jgi:hypothetical protein
MSETTKFHGIIGDMNPIEHDGGVVYEGEHGVEVLYFKGWSDDDGPRVTVSRFSVEDNVLTDLSWADWKEVASYIGMPEEELRGHAVSDNVMARAQVYESVAQYCGFIELDHMPRELTLEQAEAEHGEFVDECHAAGNKS